MASVRVKATSDFHGVLPDPAEVGDCDVLLLAGDVCPATDHSLEFQREWIEYEFAEWLELVTTAKEIIWVAGNHDFIMQEVGRRAADGQPGDRQELLRGHPAWSHYLQDGHLTLDCGLVVFGTPWSNSPDYAGWAFDASPARGYTVMERVVDEIDPEVDIIVSHGPPTGYGDKVGGPGSHVNRFIGTDALRRGIRDICPQLAVFGHNHEGYGSWERSNADGSVTQLANVSYLTDSYVPGRHPVMEFELTTDKEAA